MMMNIFVNTLFVLLLKQYVNMVFSFIKFNSFTIFQCSMNNTLLLLLKQLEQILFFSSRFFLSFVSSHSFSIYNKMDEYSCQHINIILIRRSFIFLVQQFFAQQDETQKKQTSNSSIPFIHSLHTHTHILLDLITIVIHLYLIMI